MPMIAIGLALYGWHLLTRFARCAEVRDLYDSIIKSLEKLNIDGQEIWNHKTNNRDLNEYEQRLLSFKTAVIERRIQLLTKYYGQPEMKDEIIRLRRSLTLADDILGGLSPSGYSRIDFINDSAFKIIDKCFEETYQYIDKNRRLFPFNKN